MTHEIYDELLPLYALGTLAGEDKKILERHLEAGCEECARELTDLENTAALLAWSALPKTPPSGLRDRLLDSIKPPVPITATGTEPIPFRPRPAARPPVEAVRSRKGPFAALAALAAAAAIAIGFLSWALLSASRQLDEAVRKLAFAETNSQTLERELKSRDEILSLIRDPEVRMTRLSESGAKPEPGIEVLWHPKHQRGYLFARSLPKLAADKTYELWLIAGSAPIPAAVFTTDENGNALIEIKKLPAGGLPQKFAVTVEPAGGSDQPTSPIILLGDYPS